MSEQPDNQKQSLLPGVDTGSDSGKTAGASVAQQVLSQRATTAAAQQPRNTGGRPRKDGVPNKSGFLPGARMATPGARVAQAGALAAATPAPAPSFDAEATKRAISAIVTSTDKWLRRKIERRAIKITTAQDAAELAAACGLEPEDADMLASLTTSTLQKYQTLARYAPETLLAMAFAAWGLRIAGAMHTLGELEAQRPPDAPLPPPVPAQGEK